MGCTGGVATRLLQAAALRIVETQDGGDEVQHLQTEQCEHLLLEHIACTNRVMQYGINKRRYPSEHLLLCIADAVFQCLSA